MQNWLLSSQIVSIHSHKVLTYLRFANCTKEKDIRNWLEGEFTGDSK